ncbi:MAG: transposase, partial [Acidobacteriota bacterium]
MKTKQRRKFSADFKARVALEGIKGQRTVQEIASHYGVHPNQVTTWKRQAIEELPEVFADHRLRGNES